MSGMSLAVTVALSLWLAAVIIFYLFLLILLLACKSLRNQVTHWFVINALVANLLFSLLVRPGTIGAEIAHLPTAETYCNFYIILHHVEQLAVPALLLMITVDRMIYVRDPDAYGQQMTTPVIVTMLALPWLLSFILGLVSVFGFLGGRMVQSSVHAGNNMTELYVCQPEVSTFYRNIMTFQAVMCLLMALASLLVTVLILSFYCRHRRALAYNQVYSQLEAEVAYFVKQAALLVCLLNLLFLVMFVCHFLVMELFTMILVDTHVIYFLFEMFEAILWVSFLPDLRRVVSQMCCKRVGQSEPEQIQTTLHYVANAEET